MMTPMKLHQLLLRLLRAIRRLFAGRTGPPALPAAETALQRMKRLKPWEVERHYINTSKGGPNAPKKQPCGECGSWIKRARKLVNKRVQIALYHCSRCKTDYILELG